MAFERKGIIISSVNTIQHNDIDANFNLRCGSFNIHGQGKTQVKLRKIRNLLIKGDLDVLLLQETRSDGSVNELRKWQKVFNSKQIYLSSYGTRAVGAGIIIRSNESFKVIQHHEDPRGRYVWVVGDHEESRFLFLSFYSPSISNEIRDFVVNDIYKQLYGLDENLPEFLIVGGDTNTVFNAKDKQGGNLEFKWEAINAFEQLKQRFSLTDVYRVKHPDKQEFTWEVLNPSIIRERIDMIFVSTSLTDYVSDAGIIPVFKTCSDHGIPYLEIKRFWQAFTWAWIMEIK